MKIILTDHARERMAVRGITEKMIKGAILAPDLDGIGYQGRLLVFKSFSKGVIKVVYSKEKDSHVVISVIWESIK